MSDRNDLFPGAPDMVQILMRMIEPEIADLVAALGESPEAWAGALSLHDLLRAGAASVAESINQLPLENWGVKEKMAMVSMVLTATLIRFDADPLTQGMRKLLDE